MRQRREGHGAGRIHEQIATVDLGIAPPGLSEPAENPTQCHLTGGDELDVHSPVPCAVG